MEFYFEPLYKILCILILFLVPLAPAYLLYKIAPEDRFLAKGNFGGFRIDAAGASAIYIVLFAVSYSQIKGVSTEIDAIVRLNHQIQQMRDNMPWKVQYTLTLLDENGKPVDISQYHNYISNDSIVSNPQPLVYDNAKRHVTYYMDPTNLSKTSNTLAGQLQLRNGFGTHMFNLVFDSADCKGRCVYKELTITKQKSIPNQLHNLAVRKITPEVRSMANLGKPHYDRHTEANMLLPLTTTSTSASAAISFGK